MSKRRKKVKKKNRKIVWIIESLLFIILISLLVLLKIFNPQEREKIEEKSEETVKPLVIQTQQRKLDLDQLHSSAGIVISLDDSKVIFQFQQDEKIFPASLTKIMTCILAIENINNLEATITLEPEIFDELYAQNASMAGFLPGENAKIIDILYGNILPSGGECSIALAEYVAGSEQAFVELMNEKAKDLGMNNTHFMNATGLHNESHYTTVKDIGILLQYALKNQTFNDIFQSKSYFVAPTDQHLSGFTFYSSMFKLRDQWELVLNDEILPDDIVRLLYEQQFLNPEDEDYENWNRGLITTFDLLIKKIQKLEITPADLALDPCSGSAVVTDTATGKVLACVSYPGYDNNRLANQMDNKYYYKIYNNASLPLFNRATQQLSAPGSTFKPVTIIAGLEEGVIDESTMVECDGVFDKVDPPLKCWNHAGHGAVNGVDSALKNSCNDYLCEVSYRLGMIDNDEFSDKQALNYIQEYAKMFDLDEKSGIELTESKPKITDNYAIPSAIGQGTNNFSTVQLGRYVTTLANEGTSFQLSLIDKIDGVETSPKVESQIEINKRSWEGVHAGMELYTQSTGIFDGFPISVAGKSGTAQEVKNRPDHGLFIGYAPADDPEIAVAVRIVNGYEAGNAVECGKNIFEYYFGIE